MIEDEHQHEYNYNNIVSSNCNGQAILNDTTNEYANKNREMEIMKTKENQSKEQKTQNNSEYNLSTRSDKDEAQEHDQHYQTNLKKQQQEQDEEEEVNVIALPPMRASKALFFESPSLECKRTRPDDNYIATNNNNTAIATITSESAVLFGKEMMNSSVPHSLAALALFHDPAQGMPDEEFYMTSHSCRSTPSVTPVCFRNELPMPQASYSTHAERVTHSFIPPCEDIKVREENSKMDNDDNHEKNINDANSENFTVTVKKENASVQQEHNNYPKARKSNKFFVRKTKSTSSSLSESSTSCESTTPLILPTLPPPPLPIPLSLATSTSFGANNMINNTNTLSLPSMCTQHYKINNYDTREPLRDISNNATHSLESDNNNYNKCNKTHMITPITNRLRRSESKEK